MDKTTYRSLIAAHHAQMAYLARRLTADPTLGLRAPASTIASAVADARSKRAQALRGMRRTGNPAYLWGVDDQADIVNTHVLQSRDVLQHRAQARMAKQSRHALRMTIEYAGRDALHARINARKPGQYLQLAERRNYARLLARHGDALASVTTATRC